MNTIEPCSVLQSIPQVYMGPIDKGNFKNFNSVVFELDATLDSDLDWAKEKKRAEQFICQNYKIVWYLNFGLFHQLPLPLSDTSQYRSLNIAIDHFFDFIIKDLGKSTLGVIIYKGSLDFSYNWPWDPNQDLNFRGWLSEHFQDPNSFFNQAKLPHSSLLSIDPKDLYLNEYGRSVLQFYCMYAALDYFSMLTSRFETDLLPYVLLDVSQIKSMTQIFQLLDHEDFEFIQLCLKNLPYECPHALGFETHAFANGFIGKNLKKYQKPLLHPLVGIVIPKKPIFDKEKIKKIDELIEKVKRHKPIKLIGERNITLDWHGLEELVVIEIEPDSKRKLEGFIAAGGKVVKEGAKLNLSLETPFSEYIKFLEK